MVSLIKKLTYTITILLMCSIAMAADSVDKFGGYTGLQSAETHSVAGNNAESVTGLILTDTGAFAGLDLSYDILQPDANTEFYFIIKANDDDHLYILPSDRLDNDVITNGSMEADSNWSDYNSPTTNERSSSTILDSYARHVVGDEANDGITQSGLAIDYVASDCSTPHTDGWSNYRYTALGFIKVISGTVYMKVIDGDGSTTLKDVQVGTTDGGSWEDFEVTAIDTTYNSGCGDGDIIFYCSGGACEFYLDDVVLGEYSYGYYNEYVGIDDYNTGTQEYLTMGGWRTEKINNRWWVIDPLDNVFFLKGINNFDSLTVPTSAHGVDWNGRHLCTNLMDKYSEGSCTGLEIYRMQTLLDYGFNFNGSIGGSKSLTGLSVYDEDTYGYMPFVRQSRIANYNWTDVGEADPPGTSFDGFWIDAYDSDYETELAALTLGFDETYLKTTANQPYHYSPYSTLANPWFIGYDLDEESHGTASYGHIGCQFFTATDSGTTDSDGVFDTKIAYVNYLRAEYTNGGEATFIANIGYDGSDEIVHPSSWSGVTGYDSTDTDADGTPDKDEAAITNLNTAWGTTYPTENGDNVTNAWEYVIENSGDDTYGFTTQSDTCDVYSDDSTADAEVIADMNTLMANYARKLFSGFYNYIFGPDGEFKHKKINFGMGIGRYIGWAAGLQSVDGNTKYLDVIGWRGFGSSGPSLPSSDSVYPDDDTTLAWQKAYYDITGLPIMYESYWVTAEYDTMGSMMNGTVDAVYQPGDGAVRGSYDNQSTPDCVIAQDASVSWNAGANTGTMIQMWDSTVNTMAQDRYIIVEDTADTLEDNDEVTDGSCTITVAGTPTQTSLMYDADANFDTAYDNPSALFHSYYWCILVNKDADTPPMYYMINANDWVAEHALVSYKKFGDGGYVDNSFLNLEVGDEYIIGSNDLNTSIPTEPIYLIDTQAKRATVYIRNLRHAFDVQSDSGDYFAVGWSHWSLWDYGYADSISQEVRNFGFFSRDDNAYDGVEATMLGADGTPGTWDDEPTDYGDFVTPMQTYMTSIYSELTSTGYQIDGFDISGFNFNN